MAHNSLMRMKCFKEFHERLCTGKWSPKELAVWIQEEKEERTNINTGSLERAIYRYKNDIPASAFEDKKLPSHEKRALEVLKEDVNEAKELTKLYHLQMQRIGRGTSVEETIDMLTKDTRKEILAAKDILMALAELKMKLGVYDKAAEKFEVTHRDEIDEIAPHERKELGNVAQVLLRELTQIQEEKATLSSVEVEEADYEVLD